MSDSPSRPLTASDIRSRFLEFFRSKNHAIIPSASLIPENDPTVLFTTAGMHPLVPYLMGQPHPMGKRLVDAQKCLRTDDIDEVGDNRHLTFFEMLGNWSLGDYFKESAIPWSFDFLTSEKWLNLDPKRIYVTVFEGDTDAPRDEESINLWKAEFKKREVDADLGEKEKEEPTTDKAGPRIYAYPKKKNWWGPAGQTGPCGPDTEIFYDTGKPHDPVFGTVCHPNCDCGRFVEIWNNVFMEYEKMADGSFVPLKQKNVDTGMGLERITAIMQGAETVFDTEEFQGIIKSFEALAVPPYEAPTDARPLIETYGPTVRSFSDSSYLPSLTARAYRIIADHVRAAVFVIGDVRGVVPSNIGQGYIVRRLLRRAIREGRKLGIEKPFVCNVAASIIEIYGSFYTELQQNRERVLVEIAKEEEKFGKTLEKGVKELDKMLSQGSISGEQAFVLFSTYGFPLELTEEIVKEKGQTIDHEAFAAEFKKHQDLSRTASAGAFKGGLADHSVETTRLHTATHLLHKALKTVLGDHVEQKGSNITAERLRFDFSHPTKMTAEELAEVERIVNEAIQKNYPVSFSVMSLEEAKTSGALGYFEDKYAQLEGKIKVYSVGDEALGYFSKEICGGPHVEHTGELGAFKIQKEEAVSAGVRRLKATVG